GSRAHRYRDEGARAHEHPARARSDELARRRRRRRRRASANQPVDPCVAYEGARHQAAAAVAASEREISQRHAVSSRNWRDLAAWICDLSAQFDGTPLAFSSGASSRGGCGTSRRDIMDKTKQGKTNGVDVDRLLATIGAIQQTPSLATF